MSEMLIDIRISEHPKIPTNEEEFFDIEWIEILADGKSYKTFLQAGQKPEAEFSFKVKQARAYCNLHGLWKSK